MQKRDRDFVCGLLVDFADGQAGRTGLIGAGSRERCLRTAQDLIKSQVPGNRPLAAAHIVIVPRDEWDEFYDVPGNRPGQVPEQTAMAAARTSLELIASQLRAWLPASEAAQTTAMALVRRGASELVNHIGKERTRAYLQQLLDEAPEDQAGLSLENGHKSMTDRDERTAVGAEGIAT